MLIISLVAAVLAVARLTRLFTADRVTLAVRRSIVNKWGGDSWGSYLIHCPWCLGLWFAIPIMPVAVLFPNRWVIAALAIPAGSYLVGLLSQAEEK